MKAALRCENEGLDRKPRVGMGATISLPAPSFPSETNEPPSFVQSRRNMAPTLSGDAFRIPSVPPPFDDTVTGATNAPSPR